MTTLKEIGKKERTAIVGKYLKKKYGTTIDSLKERIARKCIDLSGTLTGNYSLLLRILRRWDNISTEYYQHGEDGYTDHDRFWFEFSLYSYHDLPSGYNLRKTGDEYEILDCDKVMGKISAEELKNELVDDLVVWNEGRFNEEFEQCLNELYNWIVEVQ
jgi:hypothetical protein